MGEEKRTGLSIGPALRHAREKRGLSLEEVEQATKIRPRYIEGLEREDYDMLPAPIYIRGFLKTYATFLGLDGEALSKEMQQSRGNVEETRVDHPPEIEEPLPVARALSGSGGGGRSGRGASTRTVPFLALAGVLLVALVGTVYFVGRGLPAADSHGGRAVHDNARFISKDKASKGGTPVSKPVKRKKENARGAKSSASPGTGSTANTRESSSSAKAARTDLGPLKADIKVVGAYSWIEVRTDGGHRLLTSHPTGFLADIRSKAPHRDPHRKRRRRKGVPEWTKSGCPGSGWAGPEESLYRKERELRRIVGRWEPVLATV